MFAEVNTTVPVGFAKASSRLTGLLHDGGLVRASAEAYSQALIVLAQRGSPVPRVTGYQFGDLVVHNDRVVLSIRWQAQYPGGEPATLLEAVLTVSRSGQGAVVARVAGACYAAPGMPSSAQHEAAATIMHALLHRISAAITHPAQIPVGTRTRAAPPGAHPQHFPGQADSASA